MSSGAGGMQLRVATCLELPEPDPDAVPLAVALAAGGIEARWMGWDDPSADWSGSVPTVLRSTWNYAQDRTAFLAWCERVEADAPLWNPLAVVRANTHKSYLPDLAARGVPTVPTALLPRASGREQLAASLNAHAGVRVVIKPAVGAGSVGARAFDAGDPAALAHASVLARSGELLVQPYMPAIDAEGEHSLIWIDGELTHQVRKAPRFAGEGENITGPVPITQQAETLALAALAPWADRLLYGRVDVVRDPHGQLVVMEVELTEPSLYFTFGQGSAERYASALARRLRTRT